MKNKLAHFCLPVLAVTAIALAGCASSTGSTPATKPPLSSPPTTSISTPAPSTTSPPGTTPAKSTVAASTTPPGTTTSTASATPVSLFLKVTKPADESVTAESTITIRGQTIPDAVLSVNADIVDTDASGNFAVKVALEEGPNLFDIIATDEEGNEANVQLIVSYVP